MHKTTLLTMSFLSSYQEFTLSGDQSSTFNFKQGFQFNYYGLTFTQAQVSANGFVSFGQVDTGFPNPTVNNVRSGVRRIMSFYNDLVPEQQNGANTGPAFLNSRIYAQQFKDANGRTKVKFGHDRRAEFSNLPVPTAAKLSSPTIMTLPSLLLATTMCRQLITPSASRQETASTAPSLDSAKI